MVPEFIMDDLSLGQYQEINFSRITSLKYGEKAGRKRSDANARWVEKWMEVSFIDKEVSLADVSFQQREQSFGSVMKKDIDMIVKMFSKFWTNTENNQIEGECLI